MSEFDTLDILGCYAEGYTEPVVLPSAHLVCGEESVTFSRQPGYGEFDLLFNQAVAMAGGGTIIAYAPLAQEMIIRQPLRINGADKTALEGFFNDTVRGMAVAFTYNNPNIGPGLPVRFSDGQLPRFEEVGYDVYTLELALKVELNYPQLDPIAGNIAASGNRFALDTVVMPFPLPLRSGSGYEIDRKQSLQRDTQAASVVYEKSRTVHKPWHYPVILTAAQFVDLQAFFFTFCHGQQRKFIWTDEHDTARTVRLGADKITVKQLGFNRFSTELTLIKEVPL